jgi:cellulose synthase operon protein C
MIQQLTPPISGADQLAEVRRLYGQGLYLRAFAKAEAIAALRDWTGPERRIMAGRLAGVLGGDRLARALHLVALRESPADPTVCYFGVRAVMSRWGPWFARRLWNRIGPLPDAPRDLRADWLAHYALISATLRDFEVADHFLAEALALAPQRAWIHVERSAVLQIEDRFHEALAAAERALAIRPWYRPGVQTAAHYLCSQGRDREALELLSAADERLECGDIVAQRAALERELGLSADARQSLARLAELYPLQDKQVARWIAAVECDLASECDDRPGAVAAGRRAGRGFYERVVANLETAVPLDKRVVLPVEFVQQHHVTCAPATLAALCKFWGHDAGQLEIAEQICYDGTPHHRQRAWAEANGFTTREFAVDWDSARALVDRGVPFTMTTIQPPNSHLIAVIGYDARRRTLVLRDPSLRYRTEMLAKEGLESLRSTGPIGMVMLPHEQAHRLEGVTLQDAELYDELYELQLALERHDRDRAAAVLDRMRAGDPEHRLTLYARRALAAYDCDPSASRHSYEQMLKQFPDDTMLLLARIESRRSDATRQERIEYLSELVGTRSEPLFRLHLAEELSVDTRCHGEASQLIRRLLVQRPYEARC